MTFKQVVESTPDISNSYMVGLSALGNHSKRITVSDTTKLQGSVDIDNATRVLYPNLNRWDYCLGYKSEAFFVEVHSASTNEVKTMIKKLQWLKEWLHSKAPELNKLKAKKTPFVWIQSKNFSVPKSSPQFRLLKTNHLLPVKQLELI